MTSQKVQSVAKKGFRAAVGSWLAAAPPTLTIAVGDKVRVHDHPPDLMKSFAEGVVTRVDVTTKLGRMFVMEVTCDVILDREQTIKPGYQSYVRYERSDDFPGRLELLSKREQEPEPAPAAAVLPESEQTGVHGQARRTRGNVIRALFGR